MRIARTALPVLLLLLASSTPLAAGEFLVGEHANVVVFGDSITADGKYAQIMQDLVDAKYPERQIRFIAAGAAGDTVKRSFPRIEGWVTAWRPAWVLINLGVNDLGPFTPAEYLANYEAMINRIYRDTGAHIALMSFIYFDKERPEKKETEFIAGIQELAKKYNCAYIPCYEAFKALRPEFPKGVKYANDGTHPNMLGYWIFAETILQALGYEFDSKEVDVKIPLTRVASINPADPQPVAGTQFTMKLPKPVNVTVTPYEPPQFNVPAAKKSVVVDGKLDEWALQNPLELNAEAQEVMGVISWTRDRRNAKVYASYDEQALYFAIAVDTPLVSSHPSLPSDCIELFLDLRPESERAKVLSTLFTGKDPYVCQYLLKPQTDDYPQVKVEKGSGNAKMLEGVKLASSITKTGYILEVAIPAALFPDQKIVPGSSIGFDIGVDWLDRVTNWTGLSGLRWTTSSFSFFSTVEYGRLNLVK